MKSFLEPQQYWLHERHSINSALSTVIGKRAFLPYDEAGLCMAEVAPLTFPSM